MIGSHPLFLCLAGAKQLRSCDQRQDLLAHPKNRGPQSFWGRAELSANFRSIRVRSELSAINALQNKMPFVIASKICCTRRNLNSACSVLMTFWDLLGQDADFTEGVEQCR